MNLHANAALSWSGRRELGRRVVDEGWTLRAAAEAAGVSVRCARKWVCRYREGDRQLFDRSSAPRRVANRTAPERIAVIAKLRRLRMTAAGDRRDARDAAVDGVRSPDPQRHGASGTAWSRACSTL
jgi:transposase